MKRENIIVEEDSNNTFENISNSLKLLPKLLDSLTIITSEFHLKRYLGVIKKDYQNLGIITISSKDVFSDNNNWYLSDLTWNSGRSLVTFEANTMIKYAKEEKISDFDIPNCDKDYPVKTKY